MPPEQLPISPVSSEQPKPLVVLWEELPPELFNYRQWVCWRYVYRGQGKKPDKQPVNPHNLHNAGVHWPNSWSTSAEALARYRQLVGKGIDGIGFVLTADDPLVGVDLDACVQDGQIIPTAQAVIRQLQSYTELSPSGRGLHLFLLCPGFTQNARTASVEVYSHSRFLTITGQRVAQTPADIRTVSQEDLRGLLPQRQALSQQAATIVEAQRDLPDMSVEALWQRIFDHDQFGAQHLQRFQGDTSLDRGDHSFTVIRLLNCLARWTQGDADKMRRMILMSALRNEKWFSKRGKGDWLDHQIADAIHYVNSKTG